MGTRERRERSDASDNELATLFSGALVHSEITEGEISLCAVGGYGRGELAPGSDLDIVLFHTGIAESRLTPFVSHFLNPLWSRGVQVDYSVRTRAQTKSVARNDFKVALGLLDLRYLGGNKALFDGVFADAMKSWRRNIREYLPAISASYEERIKRAGELAFLLEPDLKESRGGLRDINILRSIDRSGLVKVALPRLAESEALLANVRDELHKVTGRHRDQLLLTEQDHVAAALNFQDADLLMTELSKAARAVDYVMQLTWHQISQKLDRSVFGVIKKHRRTPLAKGLELYRGEVRVPAGYDVASDPALGLRAAAFAAQRGLRLSVETATAIAANFTPMPEPWPRSAREDLVALLGAGPGMIDAFEALDQEGLIERWIPEWRHVRYLPQRNVLHHHTVDRHMIQTAVQAAALIRNVHRPDILLVAALFHDIGKGFEDKDHSEYGAELIAPLAIRLGFDEYETKLISEMVKHHLLLSAVATRRDLEDPATIEYVKELVKSAELLELLHALSIADGEATGRSAWSEWKASLVADLVRRTLGAMQGVAPAPRLELSTEQLAKVDQNALSVEISAREGFLDIEIISPDRPGLLSTVAAVLSISRLDVRSAKTRTVNNVAVMNWLAAIDINVEQPTAESIIDKLERALSDPEGMQRRIADRIASYRLAPGLFVPAPVVSVFESAATDATIIEVRMHDQPGILYRVSKAISEFGADIRAAIVTTLGAEAFDTIYVTDLAGGGPLHPVEASRLARNLEELLLSSR
jgi:[protein-PII] uridylyltransferase